MVAPLFFGQDKTCTRASKLLNSDGLYGKSLVTGIDAPSGPKVSRLLDNVPVASGGSSDKLTL